MSLQVSQHAVERYLQRVKPALDFPAAKNELIALCAIGQEVEPPEWAYFDEDRGTHVDRILELSDGVIALLGGRTVISVLTRGSHHPEVRAAKNDFKRRQRKKKRRSRPVWSGRNGREEPKRIWR